jgi:nucleotide-binding universal stress UspA family protein
VNQDELGGPACTGIFSFPIDGSATADKAIEAGIEFARSAKAKVTLFTAVPEYEPPGEAELMARRAISLWDHERISRDKAQAILRPAAERLRAAGIECATAYASATVRTRRSSTRARRTAAS